MTATKMYIATGMDFIAVAKAVTCINLGSHCEMEDYFVFLRENCVNEKNVAIMATHSSGDREWDVTEKGKSAPFFAEELFNGGWYHFSEGDVTRLKSGSATSGSNIEAVKVGPGNWTISLMVPMINGTPYKGCYYSNFVSATRGEFKELIEIEEEILPPPTLFESNMNTEARVKYTLARLAH